MEVTGGSFERISGDTNAPVLPAPAPEVPKRFQPPKSTLLIDRFMTHFIKVGGVSIIAAVLAIFVFIFWQILPLFRGARVQEAKTISVPAKDYKVIGIDEWGELPFLLDSSGHITFVSLPEKQAIEVVDPGFKDVKYFSAFRYHPSNQNMVGGTIDGYFCFLWLNYESVFESGSRRTTHHAGAGPYYAIGKEGYPVKSIDYGEAGEIKLVVAIQDVAGKAEVHATKILQTQSLLGEVETKVDRTFDLTGSISGLPRDVAVNERASDFLISTEQGEVYYFTESGEDIKFVQRFQPFEDLSDRSVVLMRFLLGGVSVVFANSTGVNRIFSLYQHEGGDVRLFGQIHELANLPGNARFFDGSLRNKAFLIGTDSYASIRYATTENIRWESQLPFRIRHAVLGGKYNSMLFLEGDNWLHLYRLDDPHPESSFRSLFGKVRYEGASRSKYDWQSTGATDEFEPKLSLVPLMIGSLKGTLYAMIFAIPIALLAAVYTSQFLHPNFRIFVKPTMEIMASLPSVVLGFLAALWFAPLLETRVPSVLLVLLVLPVSAILAGWLWSLLPIRFRKVVKPGYEWLAFLPVMALAVVVGWMMGPSLERMLFVVSDPESGRKVADFRLWWPQVTGLPFEQRNSLVVGFIMGFAVIPIIFTIAEDALSNVPGALRSGSLALGASRWQTAMRIVVPTASAGIFSAVMIGLGRAVGETMIVVMATGNTPILDFNIFSGMRTLSANIAVELPEAPYHSTLYRTLFLGALVLFLMTFLINTLAEILRQHLREKYKTI